MKDNEFERPDLYLYEEDEQDKYLDFIYEPEYEPCQCCGAENPININICPVCSWEYDENENEHMPSKKNHGVSLYEAKLNFGVFGSAYPPIFWKK